jgi:hypothetical protein
MSEVTVSRQQVEVDYHQFYLMPVGGNPELVPSGWSKLLSVADDGRTLIVSTGCATGPVIVTVRSSDQPPPLADSLTGWDIGVEDTFEIHDELSVVPWGAGDSYEAFTPTKPGPHRVRVLARGRAEHYDAAVEEATEEYDISIWPTDSVEERLSLGDDGVR